MGSSTQAIENGLKVPALFMAVVGNLIRTNLTFLLAELFNIFILDKIDINDRKLYFVFL